MEDHDIVAIGASAGGLEAIRHILGAMPRDLEATRVNVKESDDAEENSPRSVEAPPEVLESGGNEQSGGSGNRHHPAR